MSKKIVPVAVLVVLFVSLFPAGSAQASGGGGMASVIIVFKDPVASDDVQYLQGIGGIVKYTYTIINGVALSLPQAALARLQCMQANPEAAGSDPIAMRIKYIEPDQEMHALDGGSAAAEAKPAGGSPLAAVENIVADGIRTITSSAL